MVGSGKSVLRRLICLLCFLLHLSICVADELPSADDINQLAELAQMSYEAFLQESFELRLGYEYDPAAFSNRDKQIFRDICERTTDDLQAVERQQQQLKVQVESYQGDDWETRYGANGLWKGLCVDVYSTGLGRCEADFYLALCLDKPQKTESLKSILEQLSGLQAVYESSYLQFLKARVLVALSQVDQGYRGTAEGLFAHLSGYSDIDQCLAFRIAIERAKLLGSNEPLLLEKLAEEIAASECSNDAEIVLSLAFLQRRLNGAEAFEKTLNLFPQVRGAAGLLVLNNIKDRPIDGLSVFEAELAAEAALSTDTSAYQTLLKYLAGDEKYQSAVVLYAAGVSLAKSSPEQAVDFLVKASRLQKARGHKVPNTSTEEIAECAAHLAYTLFVNDSNNCELALRAFNNYEKIAGGQMDRRLEYLWAHVCYGCYDPAQGRTILQKIAASGGEYGKKATLILAVERVRAGAYDGVTTHRLFLQQFADSLFDANDCLYRAEAMGLVRETLSRIEEFGGDSELFSEICHNAHLIAQFFYRCQPDESSSLALAELVLLRPGHNDVELELAARLIGQLTDEPNAADVPLLRCRARLLQRQGDFVEAAKLWTKLCTLEKTQSAAINERTWQWWRAKCYQLDCWQKSGSTEDEQIVHTIDVLEASFPDIPPCWADRFKSIKERCLAD